MKNVLKTTFSPTTKDQSDLPDIKNQKYNVSSFKTLARPDNIKLMSTSGSVDRLGTAASTKNFMTTTG